MPLGPGARLGPYEIQSAIGAGGMGEVYKAKDTRLDRTVAVKVLPEHVSGDPSLRERFEREARTVAALNHPHICALYDVGRESGTDFLVLEYLEGESLANRLTKSALPIEHALMIAVQIADALDRAHRAGILHRDLKPANIVLTKTGAKLLDFGLAKVTPAAIAASGLSIAPTGISPVTVQGTILGTLQYMAPEQIEGHEADARTDIFAFGCVLYEMVTGTRAFDGKTQASVIASILDRQPPPISDLAPLAPPVINRIVTTCIAKDPDDRWQTMRDLLRELRWIGEEPSGAALPKDTTRRVTLRYGLLTSVAALLALATLILATLLIRSFLRPAAADPTLRFTVAPPDNAHFDSGAGSAAAYNAGSISADGSKLAFTARDQSGRIVVFVRPLDSVDAAALPGTDGAAFPFWSPDSRSIAFFADGKLKRIDANGGPVQAIADVAFARGGAWGGSPEQGVIVFARSSTGPLYRVSDRGGDVTPLTTIDPQQRGHRIVGFLPDGQHFTFFAFGVRESGGLFLTDLAGDPPKRLGASDSGALYSGGYLLFVNQGTLMAQQFSLKTLQFTGQPVPFDTSVAAIQAVPGFSVSSNGTLTYRKGGNAQDLQLAWFDRSGRLIRTIGQPGGYISPSVALDGRRIVVHRHDGSGGDVWLATDGQTLSRFTFDASQDNSNPIWSPDGRTVAFGSLRNGKWGIYVKPADGSATERLIVESPALSMPMSWSPDGQYVVYYAGAANTLTDLWAYSVRGDGKPIPIAQTEFAENHAQVSPDGKWIAFNSDESGTNQIYVKPFPTGAGKWQASTSGGSFARWRRDGKELFYLEAPDGARMMSVDVKVNDAGHTIEFSPPRALFDSGYYNPNHPTNFLTYDVSPDGQRFLIARPRNLLTNPIENTPITVVTHWAAALKK